MSGATSALFLRPAQRGRPPGTGAAREPRLVGPATEGTFLLHADLHNHTDMSDGFGRADDAFGSMRDAGLDAAALTDHAGISDRAGVVNEGLLEELCRVAGDPGMPSALIGEREWVRAAALADAADDPGRFTAVRGFEWTTPHLGHVNVWFSPDWTTVDDVDPATGMRRLRDWVAAAAAGPGGADLLAGFNHPGREALRFEGFAFDARLADRVVSLEMFNRDFDYLFEGWARGERSPLVDCLDAGWRPGLIGVSDEHTPHWGFQPGRGRAGVWVREWSRAGLREALATRRFFATREPGLRVDVVAAWGDGSVPPPAEVAARRDAVRMGGRLGGRPGNGPGIGSIGGWGNGSGGGPGDRQRVGEVVLAVDVDGGPMWQGRDIAVQVLTTGERAPEVLTVEPGIAGTPLTVRVPVRGAGVPWLVARIADPDAPNERPGPDGHPGNRRALAYTSPIHL